MQVDVKSAVPVKEKNKHRVWHFESYFLQKENLIGV